MNSCTLDQIPVSFNLNQIRQKASSKYVHTLEIPVFICSYHKWVFFKLSYHTCSYSLLILETNMASCRMLILTQSVANGQYVSSKKWLTKFLILILIIKTRWHNRKKYMLKQTTTSNSFHLTASKVQYIQLHVTEPVLTKKNYNNFLQKWLQAYNTMSIINTKLTKKTLQETVCKCQSKSTTHVCGQNQPLHLLSVGCVSFEWFLPICRNCSNATWISSSISSSGTQILSPSSLQYTQIQWILHAQTMHEAWVTEAHLICNDLIVLLIYDSVTLDVIQLCQHKISFIKNFPLVSFQINLRLWSSGLWHHAVM